MNEKIARGQEQEYSENERVDAPPLVVLSSLYTPTHIVKILNHYYVVDCWHHRVIFSNDIYCPIAQWKILDNTTLRGPHSIASDGEVMLVDNTERHAVNVYAVGGGRFPLSVIDGVGTRPHRIIYCDDRGCFYVLSSGSQDIYILKRNRGLVEVCDVKPLGLLKGIYCRSFGIIDGRIHVFGSTGVIGVYNHLDDSFEMVGKYMFPGDLCGRYGINDVARIGSSYYLSRTPCGLFRAASLVDFVRGEYVSIDLKTAGGTPYYFSEIDNRTWVPFIALPPELAASNEQESSGLIRMGMGTTGCLEIEQIFHTGQPSALDYNIRSRWTNES